MEGTFFAGPLCVLTSIPQIYRHLNRWYEILAVLSKYELASWINRLGPEFTKDLLKAPGGTSIARHRWETRLRLALSELGPTFIKLGQLLSTRPDLAGITLSEELQQLQANAPADPPDAVRKMIEGGIETAPGRTFCRVRGRRHGLGIDRAGAPGPAPFGRESGGQSSAHRH